jgi:hypothetical protein
MAEIIDKMELRNTGHRIADIGDLEIVTISSINEVQLAPEHLYVYRLDVALGVEIQGSVKDVTHRVKHQVKPMVQNLIFGEFRKELYEIKHAAYNRNYEEVARAVDRIYDNMFGEN